MNIWAHRGCSQMYPENTITAFEKAMNIPGLAGIELDIQLTRDGELVVIHDERVDRTTDGFGNVRDFTLSELNNLHIYTGTEKVEHIPTMREVFELLAPKLLKYKKGDEAGASQGIRLNIELKNSVYSYPGMEGKIVDMVREFGVQDAIVYSTFYADSLVRVHEIDPDAELGVLDSKVSDCLYKAMGLERYFDERKEPPAESSKESHEGESADEAGSDCDKAEKSFSFALHPYGNMIDIDDAYFLNRTVRAWFSGHLFPEKSTGGKLDIFKYEALGVTDFFLNEPEKYL